MTCRTALASDTFWSRVDKSGKCWEWVAYRLPDGYGQMSIGGHTVYAHRFSYEQLVGPIPAGMTIDHLCRNRACVNPAHLEVVTNRENILRGRGPSAENARKDRCHNGHPFDGRRSTDGKRYCRSCRNEYRRTRLATDPEYRQRRNAQQRAYHARKKVAA
ncbi:MAG: HNH endonuclease [Desulfobacterales bacterium]|jgi:hypothetical protein|nr:HNH endonuclease [Desulfobacterales bacterium]